MNPLYAILLIPVWSILMIIEFRRAAAANRLMRVVALTAALISLALILVNSRTGRLLPEIRQKSAISLNDDNKTGLTKIGWADEISLGDSLVVKGEYVNRLSQPTPLYLVGFGSKVDSIIVKPGKTGRFTLKTVPRITGHFTYALKTSEAGDLKEIGAVPVDVTSSNPLHILILNSSPSFENRYLKDWLSINNNSVAILTLNSTANYLLAFQNMAVTPLKVVNSALLARFDLLVIDVLALKNLTAPEFQALSHAISEQGMGVIIQQDTLMNNFTAAALHLSGLKKAASQADTLSTINIAGAYTLVGKLPLLPIVVTPAKNAQPLLLNQGNEILANLIARGKGRIVQTVIDHSYSWLLRGEKSDYSYLWSALLNAVSRKKTTVANWKIETRFPRKDAPMLIHYITPSATIPEIRIEQDAISMRQNEDLQQIWSGTFWPKKTGWNQLLAKHETSHWFYVYSGTDWSLTDILPKQQETAGYENPLGKNQTPPPLFIDFIIFISSLTYLWLEQKLYKQKAASY